MTTTETCRAATDHPGPIDVAPLGTQLDPDHAPCEDQRVTVGVTHPPRLTNDSSDPRVGTSGGDANHRQANHEAIPTLQPPAGSNSTTGQPSCGAHTFTASGGPNSQQAMTDSIPKTVTPAGSDGGQAAKGNPNPRSNALLDPTLLIAAEIVDDLEKTRIANENRLRQLTRDETDKDGEERGFGLTEDHPAVARVASIVDGIAKLEKDATRNLEKAMRDHPLGPWVEAQRGIGKKQAARLLAAIGDPYWNDLHQRPRTVSELWAYCGYHVLPAGHTAADTQGTSASGAPASGSDTGQGAGGDHIRSAGVAPRRQKGRKSNWSEDARKRSWLIVQSVIKSGGPWREVYDTRKAATVGKLHDVECVRCGPKNTPAKVGTPLSDAHRHADAIRITAKEILKGLWVESRRLHGGE